MHPFINKRIVSPWLSVSSPPDAASRERPLIGNQIPTTTDCSWPMSLKNSVVKKPIFSAFKKGTESDSMIVSFWRGY